jgi:uncharacterized membrane protein YgaE (UPF0421/DUF939 family)
MKYFGSRTIKTALGAMISMLIAMTLGLKYGTAAGVITILSIQSTKRQSFQIAAQRMGACILALLLSTLFFKILGFNAVVFGLYLLIFIPTASRFKLNEGIVVSSVLVTHLLVEKKADMGLLFNEIGLMVIGVSIALLLNLYMPSIEKKLKEDQEFIENSIREILSLMAEALKEKAVSIKEDATFKNLEYRLLNGRARAYKNLNNTLFSDNSYYVKYMDMRFQQLETLKSMRTHFNKFFMTYTQTIMMSDFTRKVSDSIHENNTAAGLLQGLSELRLEFSAMELPKTREEFENRAMLYQFLNDMERFLTIKNDFKIYIKNNKLLDLY